MREILISTETGSDMPKNLAEKYQINIIPMHVVMDGVDYPDGSIPVEQIYDYHKKTKKIPTTSATNVGEYTEFFKKLQQNHPGCVIMHFAYSSVASCTYQNAKIAMEDFDDIYLIDTASVTGGCTAHILKAWEVIQAKKDTVTDYQALAQELQELAYKVSCSFIPGNLDYLKAGGRVSNAAYLGATLLKIKPLIEIDRDGHLLADKKYRGSMMKFVDQYIKEFVTSHNLNRERIFLMYSKGTDQAILDRMKEVALELGYKECIYIQTGCVISCHSGPGAIGLAGMSD